LREVFLLDFLELLVGGCVVGVDLFEILERVDAFVLQLEKAPKFSLDFSNFLRLRVLGFLHLLLGQPPQNDLLEKDCLLVLLGLLIGLYQLFDHAQVLLLAQIGLQFFIYRLGYLDILRQL
jgi:hypothetical protein